jgi:glucose/arabinose dehydrogenase
MVSFAQPAMASVSLENAFPALSFTRPVDLQNAGDGSNRLFVLEQAGLIYAFDNFQAVTSKSVFLDIQARVDNSGNEEGLLGLAFHPDYENNGYFYVNYTSSVSGLTHISRFSVSETDSNQVDPGSELVLMQIPKPYQNHNAGALAFGPEDGYLYITTGDGGSAGDPNNNGQDRTTLLGSILRIDVDSTETGLNYAIPGDNPYSDNPDGYREEIYAYGLRNPWRVSFDPVTGWLWAADVGQSSWEEIDIIQSGGNYGWRVMEGAHCYNPPTGCDSTGMTGPIWEYDHSLGYSVTGGYVYNGCCVPELAGKYIYGDYGSGRIWSLEYDGMGPTVNTELLDTALHISSFGVDQAGEIYICAFDDSIYRFEGTASIDPGGSGD